MRVQLDDICQIFRMTPGMCSIKANYFKKFTTTNNGNDCGQKLGARTFLGFGGGEIREIRSKK